MSSVLLAPAVQRLEHGTHTLVGEIIFQQGVGRNSGAYSADDASVMMVRYATLSHPTKRYLGLAQKRHVRHVDRTERALVRLVMLDRQIVWCALHHLRWLDCCRPRSTSMLGV